MGSDGVRRDETLGLVRMDAQVEPKLEIGGARVEPKMGTEGTTVGTGTEPRTGAES